MKDIIDKLCKDMAIDIMAREDARRAYQGEAKTEKVAYYTGRIEYAQALKDYLRKYLQDCEKNLN